MIEANNAYIGYKNVEVLRNINIKIDESSVLVGPNGSGKTTFLNSILGFSKVIRGKLSVFGKDVSKLRNFIGISTNLVEVYKILSVKIRDLIKIYAELYGGEVSDALNLLNMFNFNSFDKKIYEISLGQQKILANVLALAFNPKLALLDEPFENLDQSRRLKMIKLLKEMRNCKVVLTTHEINLVKKLKEWKLYLVFNGSIYGPFSTTDELYVSRGKISDALVLIQTNNGYLSVTRDNGELPLSSIGDIENLEAMLND
jgi:ABC-type multidrug transport system ATPase subunit